jgi:DNA modification methylase
MPIARGESLIGDSRSPIAPLAKPLGAKFDWVITSPPYYGMRTYIQDQWLRNWFVGGSSTVDYTAQGQLSHMSPHAFSLDLANVWDNVAEVCKPGARLVIRFGGIRDRNLDPLEIVKHSLLCSGWRVLTVRHAGSADAGKRQADAFLTHRYEPMAEYDIWARLA